MCGLDQFYLRALAQSATPSRTTCGNVGVQTNKTKYYFVVNVAHVQNMCEQKNSKMVVQGGDSGERGIT